MPADLIAALDAAPAATRLRACTYHLLRTAPGAFVADIGCGTGRAIAELTARGVRTTGVDLDEEMIAAARTRHPDADLRVTDARASRSRDGELTGCRADKVLHDLPVPAHLLTEAHRVLAPGGRIMLCGQDWTPSSSTPRSPTSPAHPSTPAHASPQSHSRAAAASPSSNGSPATMPSAISSSQPCSSRPCSPDGGLPVFCKTDNGERVFGWWGGAGVRGRPSKVKGAFGVASRWTSSTLDFGASAAPEAALGAGSACPAPGRATPPPPSVTSFVKSSETMGVEGSR
ncbi:hypothetical protein GCM10009527_022920 [Actinomadura nitritigenes]|uniref:Methyltransferase domain-containing protein n=1 Tax=Actinomadura nitritigenes TaxID=134602 RepID=A0ABS3RCV2_9ACTN|nr:methyltransferase domain-containing protein [Actinomadura nitritigenes]MBO2444060.1 methyltransferase domain-containing protein [Actinomadura nitritigenes]